MLKLLTIVDKWSIIMGKKALRSAVIERLARTVSVSICRFLWSQRDISPPAAVGEKKKKADAQSEQSIRESPEIRIICERGHIFSM